MEKIVKKIQVKLSELGKNRPDVKYKQAHWNNKTALLYKILKKIEKYVGISLEGLAYYIVNGSTACSLQGSLNSQVKEKPVANLNNGGMINEFVVERKIKRVKVIQKSLSELELVVSPFKWFGLKIKTKPHEIKTEFIIYKGQSP